MQCRVRACVGAEMAKLTTFRVCQTQQGIDSQLPPAVMWDDVNLENCVASSCWMWWLSPDILRESLIVVLTLLSDTPSILARCFMFAAGHVAL